MDIWLPTQVTEKLDIDQATNASAEWSKAHLRGIARALAPNRKARRKLLYSKAPLVGTNLGPKHTHGHNK